MGSLRGQRMGKGRRSRVFVAAVVAALFGGVGVGVGLPVVVPALSNAGVGDPVAPLSDDEWQGVRSLVHTGVLRVSTRTCDGLTSGTAFVLEAGVVTNQHVVAGAVEAKLEGLTAPVIRPVVAASAAHDLALLGTSAAPVFETRGTPVADGEMLVLVGFPGGGSLQMIEARAHHYDSATPWGLTGSVLLIDAETTGGFSGGPVLDRSGRVVAMLSGFDQVTELTVAIPAAVLEDWVAQPMPERVSTC